MSSLFTRFGRFRRSDDGSATIEFVILFPMIMTIVLMGIESGFYMVRNIMLERAVDISMRDVRLGNGRVPSIEALKTDICDNGVISSTCEEDLRIEMREVAIAPGGVDVMAGAPLCTNVSEEDPDQNASVYTAGDINSMMIVRVCALQKPFFPTTHLGAGMIRDVEGNFNLVASAAFVTEPGTRALAAVPPPVTTEASADQVLAEAADGDTE